MHVEDPDVSGLADPQAGSLSYVVVPSFLTETNWISINVVPSFLSKIRRGEPETIKE
jgi:hypothetical protein